MSSKQRALVLGLGVSGCAASELLLRDGWGVVAIDRGSSERVLAAVERLRKLGVEAACGVNSLPSGKFELCVVSPGIPDKSPWVLEIEQRGVEVISELELGFRHCKCPIVAVTGTNGKSTLVKLLHDTFLWAGLKSVVAGNYGRPLCDVVAESESLDWAVVEVSSFQMEKSPEFSPKIGVLLNIMPDHLNRHGSMDEYIRLKFRMFGKMQDDGLAVVNCHEIPLFNRYAPKLRMVSIGDCASADVGYCEQSGMVTGLIYGHKIKMNISGSYFDNPVTSQAAAAAAAVMRECGVGIDVLERAIKEFKSLAHRMEHVCEIRGVKFVDDSKATNMAALAAALRMCSGRVRLIAGGELKEKSVGFVKEVLATKAVCVYVIGVAGEYLKTEWGDTVKCVESVTLEHAVGDAWRDSCSGDTVLLSPGCASFDQFDSYKARGSWFKKLVEDINEK